MRPVQLSAKRLLPAPFSRMGPPLPEKRCCVSGDHSMSERPMRQTPPIRWLLPVAMAADLPAPPRCSAKTEVLASDFWKYVMSCELLVSGRTDTLPPPRLGAARRCEALRTIPNCRFRGLLFHSPSRSEMGTCSVWIKANWDKHQHLCCCVLQALSNAMTTASAWCATAARRRIKVGICSPCH